ncbi:MAG: hypothetical protein IJY17_08440 [Alphaproteobacteria bacterium]|nr:hypothetical protein [Alphaproteobacteria bacterium]
MTESAKKDASKKLTLRKSTLETFVSGTARGVMNAKERLKQKKEKALHAVPFLEKIDRRLKAFDTKMERKYGQVYVKLRDSAKNIARTVLAAKLFGLPGVVGICAYKTCEKAMSLLEPAQKAKQNGEAKGVLDYLSKNKGEAHFTMTSGAISIATAACDVAGAYVAKGALRVGKATLLITPEVKRFVDTTGKWFRGQESFKEVKRDAAVMGITFGTYFVSDVPMTRGSGKPQTAEESEKTGQLLQSKELPSKTPQEKLSEYMKQVKALFAAGFGNPGGMITMPQEPKTESEKAPAPEKSAVTKESKVGYKEEVNKLFASGAGNPGGMITVFDIKSQKGGR